MKSYKIIAIALLVTFAFSCKKNDVALEQMGEFDLNGQNWKAQKISTNNINDSLFGFSFAKGVYTEEYNVNTSVFSFKFLRKEIGKRTLFNRTVDDIRLSGINTPSIVDFFLLVQDGEFISEYFRPLESDSVNNWIEITKQEDNFKKVWGKFSVTLIKEETSRFATYPDTLRVRNGSFYVEK